LPVRQEAGHCEEQLDPAAQPPNRCFANRSRLRNAREIAMPKTVCSSHHWLLVFWLADVSSVQIVHRLEQLAHGQRIGKRRSHHCAGVVRRVTGISAPQNSESKRATKM